MTPADLANWSERGWQRRYQRALKLQHISVGALFAAAAYWKARMKEDTSK
jgi:hypothetical protein